MVLIRNIMLLLILLAPSHVMAEESTVKAEPQSFPTYDIETSQVKTIPKGMTAEEWGWVQDTIEKSMSFTSANYQNELQSYSKNFTPRGWEQFTKEIVENKLLERGDGEFSIAASLRSAPILVQTGELGGTQNWLLNVSLSILYKVGSESRIMRSEKNVLIERSAEKTPALLIAEWATVKPIK